MNMTVSVIVGCCSPWWPFLQAVVCSEKCSLKVQFDCNFGADITVSYQPPFRQLKIGLILNQGLNNCQFKQFRHIVSAVGGIDFLSLSLSLLHYMLLLQLYEMPVLLTCLIHLDALVLLGASFIRESLTSPEDGPTWLALNLQ